MLNELCRAFGSLFCSHEWVRRREPHRVYLECVRCLATTPGIVVNASVAEAMSQEAHDALEMIRAA